MYIWLALIWLTLVFGFALGMILIASQPSPRFGGLFYTMCAGFLCSALGLYGYPNHGVILFVVLLVLYPMGLLAALLFKTAFPPDRDLKLEREQQTIEFWAFVILAVVVGGMYILPPAFEYITKLAIQAKALAKANKELLIGIGILGVGLCILAYFLYVL